MKCLIQGLVLRPDPKQAGSPLVQFPLPFTASETWTHENLRMCFLEEKKKKKTRKRTQKTHVEMLKKENSKAKGKLRRGCHILAY